MFWKNAARKQVKAVLHGYCLVSDTVHVPPLAGAGWQLSFPVYRFDTGDGNTDAIVGMVKATGGIL